MSGRENKQKVSRNVSLPLARVKMIMKSSPEVTSISQDALHLITLATEYFIQHLAQLALDNSKRATRVKYGDLAEVVNDSQKMEFLQDIIPCKIKASDYMELLQNEKQINEDDYM